jgi:thioredoxin-related protein
MKILITTVLVFVSALSFGQASAEKPAVPIKWMTFEEAVQKSKTEKRKIFIDLYTDWCGWCKVMDKKTFTDPLVARMLNDKFYPVKFNAEQREDVVYNGTTFKFVESGRGGYHQLAASLLNNQLSYPNFVFLTEEFHLVQMIPGYTSLPGFRKPEEFHLFLSFVGEDHFRKMKLEDYQKVYKSPYPATTAQGQ